MPLHLPLDINQKEIKDTVEKDTADINVNGAATDTGAWLLNIIVINGNIKETFNKKIIAINDIMDNDDGNILPFNRLPKKIFSLRLLTAKSSFAFLVKRTNE
ncbi:TPA: hypothetical protein N2R15_002465 [Citrobacter amalonaticus]|nr:hypothetical protein [Citrobacter amalonaticus]